MKMRNRLNEGAIIWGGEIEEQDPYHTRKALITDFLNKSLQIPEEKKPEKNPKDDLKKLVDDIKERYSR